MDQVAALHNAVFIPQNDMKPPFENQGKLLLVGVHMKRRPLTLGLGHNPDLHKLPCEGLKDHLGIHVVTFLLHFSDMVDRHVCFLQICLDHIIREPVS